MEFTGYNLGFNEEGLKFLRDAEKLKKLAQENGLSNVVSVYESALKRIIFSPQMFDLSIEQPDFGQRVIGYRHKTGQYVFCQYLGNLWGLERGGTAPKGAIKRWFPLPTVEKEGSEK